MTQQITIPLTLLEQLVEVLEGVEALIEHQYTGTREAMNALQNASDDAQEAIEPLRTALAQQQQEPDLSAFSQKTQARIRGWLADGTFVGRAIGTIQEQERELMRHEALAQQGGQPVAWYDEEMDCAYTATELDGGTSDGLIPLYTAAPAPQPAQTKQVLENLEQLTAPQPAQPVPPQAWAIQGSYIMYRGEHAEMDAKAEAKRCGGTCYAYPLYCLPPVGPNIQNYLEKDISMNGDEYATLTGRGAKAWAGVDAQELRTGVKTCETCAHFEHGKRPGVRVHDETCYECNKYYANKWEAKNE